MKKYLGGIKAALRLYKKRILLICAAGVFLRVLLPYVSILMPKLVIDGITSGNDETAFMWTVGGAALLLVALNYLKSFTDPIINDAVGTLGIDSAFMLHIKKRIEMDYGLMEHPDFKAIYDKSHRAINSNHAPACNVPRMLVELFANVGGFILYSYVIIMVHPLLLALLLLCAALNWLMLSRERKHEDEQRSERGKLDGRLRALKDTMRDPKSAKDIRLYSAYPWLSRVYRKQFADYRGLLKRSYTKTMQTRLAAAFTTLVRDGAAYAFLVWLVIDGRMTAGDFVFMFAAIGALAGWVSGVLTAASDLAKACADMNEFNRMIEFRDQMNTGKGCPLPSGADLPPSIEMKNVSFTYPTAQAPTLCDINLSIKAGERIAIVGANGAGKTTLVMLLCGLLCPSEGEVRLAGRSVSEYNRDEYYTVISAVFQDIHMLAASVAVNVAQSPTPDMERVRRCLDMVGLDIDPETLLVRAVHSTARELSGGEKQKLAMARALYKDAPVILLDEPTAALDPIAESEVYEKYAQLVEDKTSVYISHRLASTRFCDRILLISGNAIAEQGTHDELMRKGGIYAKMFEVQASYYREEETA